MQTKVKKDFEIHNDDYKFHLNEDVDSVIDEKRAQLEARLYSNTKGLLMISQFFICAPTAVHRPKGSESTGDKILYFLHLIWCIGLYIGLSIIVYDEYTSSNSDLPTVQKPLYMSEYLMYMSHLLEIILAIYRGREKFWQFFDFIIDFDRQLVDLKLSINYTGLYRFIIVHLLLIAVHFISTVVIGYFYSTGILLNILRTSTVYLLPNCIIHISLVHYYGLFYLIAERSEKLYYLLEKLLQKSSDKDIMTFRHQLHVLRGMYAKLEQFTRDVNDAFSYSIVLVYVASFLNICINIFLVYKFLAKWNVADLAWTAYSTVWICMHVGKMWLILYYNENVQSKKTKASHLLSTFRYENQALEPTIRHFMLQLMSDTRSNVICGLAALNLNFVTSLLVAISTLFIFLVQYDITFDALIAAQNAPPPVNNLQ